MTQYLSIDTAPRPASLECKREKRPVAVWLFILAAVIFGIAALICDASFTPEQRIQAYQQSGIFP